MRTDAFNLFPTLVALFLAAICATGCGSDEERLTKSQFLKRGNAICAQAEAEQVRLASRYQKGQLGPGEQQSVLAVFVPPMDEELRRLENLKPPQNGENKIELILVALRNGIEDAKADYLDLFVKQTDPFVDAAEPAHNYGL